MNLPHGKTEAEVLLAIEKAVNILAPSFVFGYFDLDDIKQQGRVYALQALAAGGYDPSRPLENFLYAHIRNRYINLRRDKLRRSDAPCLRCHAGDPCGEDGQTCRRYDDWLARNQAKANILRPLDIEHIADERERRARVASTVCEDAERDELLRRIDEQLPVELRSSYLQMRAGVSIPRARRLVVEAAVKEILGCLSEDD
jgi:hypothetical protein